jgi:predicted transcriptional regulator
MNDLVPKLIQIAKEDKDKLEEIAKKKRMTSNQLIRTIIAEYLEKEV